jgi:hypothetical protein
MAELAIIIVLAVMLMMNSLNKKKPEIKKEQPKKDVVEKVEGEKMMIK